METKKLTYKQILALTPGTMTEEDRLAVDQWLARQRRQTQILIRITWVLVLGSMSLNVYNCHRREVQDKRVQELHIKADSIQQQSDFIQQQIDAFKKLNK